ncbi:MAG: hypothetical protein F6J93_27175 [Oscillatoria sp. SIO1A7]|nr:hypothetical protein [Oscillatoria sp. SIO1A7]
MSGYKRSDVSDSPAQTRSRSHRQRFKRSAISDSPAKTRSCLTIPSPKSKIPRYCRERFGHETQPIRDRFPSFNPTIAENGEGLPKLYARVARAVKLTADCSELTA